MPNLFLLLYGRASAWRPPLFFRGFVRSPDLAAAFAFAYVALVLIVPLGALGGLFAPGDALREQARRELLAAVDSGAAVVAARTALSADPAAPHRWADYGDALLMDGRTGAAAEAFRAAVERGPSSVAVLRRAAHFHFSVDQSERALELSRRLLALQPAASETLFPVWDRMGVAPEHAFAAGLPDDDSRSAYMRRRLEAGDSSDIDAAWDLLVARDEPAEELLDDYVTQLLAEGRFERALEVRRDASSCGVETVNLLRDGGFECEPVPTPLDWRLREHPEATVRRTADHARSGDGALRVEFTAAGNPLFYHVSQQTPVEPGLYRVRAWIRTEGITTDEGVGVWIVDPSDSKRLSVATPTAVGTADWRRYQRVFRVPAGVELLEVRVFRRPSGRSSARLSGVAWVDDISLQSVR